MLLGKYCRSYFLVTIYSTGNATSHVGSSVRFTLVPSQIVCVVPIMVILCSNLISNFPVMLLRYFLNDLYMVSIPLLLRVLFLFVH